MYSFGLVSEKRFSVELSANRVIIVQPHQSVSMSQYTCLVIPFQSGSIPYKPLGSDHFISLSLLQSYFVEMLLSHPPDQVYISELDKYAWNSFVPTSMISI
jgi:hypothetical protein